jgi:hypothetical protein
MATVVQERSNFGKFQTIPWCKPDFRLTPEAAKELERAKRTLDSLGGEIHAQDVVFLPFGGLAADNVQAALEELDTEKASSTALTVGLAGKQPLDATLTAVAGAATAANKLIYWTGVDVAAVTDFSAFARTLLDDADAATMRGTLGLGTLATQNGTFSGTSSGTNTGDQFTATTASRLIGRGSAAGAGAAQEITLGTGLTMSGTTLNAAAAGTGDVVGPASAVNNRVVFFDGATGKLIKDSGLTLSGSNTGDQTITLTGDVTGSGTGSFAATIGNDAVTYAKMQNVSAASKLLGRGDSGSGDPQEITLGTNLTMSGTTLNATGGGDPAYSPGSISIATETGQVRVSTLKLTGAQQLAIAGTGRLVIVG